MAAVKFAQGLIVLVLTASMFAVSMANKDWSFGFNYTDWWSRYGNHHQNKTQQLQPKEIIVGGSEHWHYGYNYTDWAIKNGPFYVNDTLVFKYDAPNATTFPHSVRGLQVCVEEVATLLLSPVVSEMASIATMGQ
ncbi:Phytocyanin domain [Sesbania bispinosa]|nr:Phytocyanin domain [Sesbania bispinosa]